MFTSICRYCQFYVSCSSLQHHQWPRPSWQLELCSLEHTCLSRKDSSRICSLGLSSKISLNLSANRCTECHQFLHWLCSRRIWGFHVHFRCQTGGTICQNVLPALHSNYWYRLRPLHRYRQNQTHQSPPCCLRCHPIFDCGHYAWSGVATLDSDLRARRWQAIRGK